MVVKFDIWVLVKGLLMGAADIVPGVSGGTVAFITGIYERLLTALKSILPEVLRLLKSRKFTQFWVSIDGGFLLTLFSGILISVLSLAKIISYLLSEYPIPLWATFFGLIIGSIYIISKELENWTLKLIGVASLGAVIAFYITGLSPVQVEPSLLNIFLSGAVAICAMVLPGLSGSFILVMLGTYSFILLAIKDLNLTVLLVFSSGCLVGLLSIANILVWTFARYQSATLAILTGLMIGALNKVWPWKEVLQYRLNSHGQKVALIEQNVLPSTYETITSLPSQLPIALICALGAILFVVLVSKAARKSEQGLKDSVI